MKRKIITILIVALAISGGALGYDLIKINVEKAQELAIENDRNIKIDELYLQADVIDYNDAKRDAQISERTTYYGKITTYYTPFIRETDVLMTTKNNGRNIAYLEKEVLSLSYDYVIKEDSLQSTTATYEQVVKEYEQAKLNSDTTAVEMMQFEYDVKAASINKDKAMNAFAQAKTSLEAVLNEGNIVDINSITYTSPYDIDVDKAIEKAMENNIELFYINRIQEAKKIMLDITKEHYSEYTSKYMTTLASYEKAVMDVDDKKVSLEVDVINDIENLKTYYDAIELEKINEVIKKADYETALLQYEKGFLSQDQLTAKKSIYDSTAYQILQKQKTYLLALKDFEINTQYNH